MHSIMRSIAPGLIVLLAGCEPAPPPPPPPSPFTTTLALKQVMEWVIDPAADVIWDSVKSVITEKGTQEIAPQTAADWDKVRDASATLIEAGNLLMIDGRARDNKAWMAAARRLSETAGQALKAAQAKNTAALFDEGGNIYKTCAACHAQYAKHLDGPPAAPANKAAEPAKTSADPAKK
jgi:hypothetical protein